jgi:hypothetical protein
MLEKSIHFMAAGEKREGQERAGVPVIPCKGTSQWLNFLWPHLLKVPQSHGLGTKSSKHEPLGDIQVPNYHGEI